mgnify:FL=1|jgi:hypothetical protein|tara:strand:+ start:192 stop:413 length:222 start_codon:yes stop_codon:yes gene_type:complete
MRDLILSALASKYSAELEVLAVNIENYLSGSVGVPEHPDLVGEVDKLIEQVAAAEEKLRIVNDLLKIQDMTKQ